MACVDFHLDVDIPSIKKERKDSGEDATVAFFEEVRDRDLTPRDIYIEPRYPQSEC